MGFLEVGTALSWSESESVRAYVKEHGLLQLLHIWRLNKDRKDAMLRWGEEVEYALTELSAGKASVYLNAAEVLQELEVRERIRRKTATHLSSDWHPEFANHMVEALPSPPYPLTLNALLMVEPSMRLRRAKIQSVLPDGKFVTSQTAFPRLGLPDGVNERRAGNGTTDFSFSVTDSVFVPDQIITPHPRFATLVRNVRHRRGAKPFILVPVYRDVRTTAVDGDYRASAAGAGVDEEESDWSQAQPIGNVDRFSVERLARSTHNPVEGHIYMDCFAFGMGMSCVQTTFAAPNISAARYLYDQLTVLAPLFLALTASTPVLRGYLAATDTRWSTLEQSVDCRTVEEMKFIPKSRYSGVSLYISDRPRLQRRMKELNDTNPPINANAKQILEAAGMDETLASHFAHLWIRDPMVIFAERVELDDTQAVDHFENIQSTNWNSVRFKPPPLCQRTGPDDDDDDGTTPPSSATPGPIGWRVEFRTPELQLTDTDNSAGVALLSVLAQMIMAYDLDLYIPMSLNDANMRRSWEKDAVTKQRFFFRRDIGGGAAHNGAHNGETSCDSSVAEMTLFEILTGCESQNFKGLLPMCEEFVAEEVAAGRCGPETQEVFQDFSQLLVSRSNGTLLTCAQYLRKFVQQHPLYRGDSVISPTIAYDLTVLSINVGFGLWGVPEMHGESLCARLPQTPLPYATQLPTFSQELLASGAVRLQADGALSSEERSTVARPLVLLVRKAVLLNAIENIYTMPLGVTSRVGASSRRSEGPERITDLWQLVYGELLKQSVGVPPGGSYPGGAVTEPAAAGPTTALPGGTAAGAAGEGQPGAAARGAAAPGPAALELLVRSPLSQSALRMSCAAGAVSSEDFTQWWLLKGFDCVGSDCGGCLAHLRSLQRANVSTTDESNCSSTADCALVGDELIAHDLSRALSLSFDTEEDLEYFKQICDSSA